MVGIETTNGAMFGLVGIALFCLLYLNNIRKKEIEELKGGTK